MNATISIEKYVFMEVMGTLELAVQWVKGVKRDSYVLQKQWHKLLKAVHLFMLDIEVVEFKDLKLPSEEKSSQNRDEKEKKPKRKAVQKKAKQLTLFFVKYSKKILFYLVVAAELIVENMKDLLVKNEPDFENRIRQ